MMLSDFLPNLIAGRQSSRAREALEQHGEVLKLAVNASHGLRSQTPSLVYVSQHNIMQNHTHLTSPIYYCAHRLFWTVGILSHLSQNNLHLLGSRQQDHIEIASH